MKMVYVTLNDVKEARKIGREILRRKLANCVNFFPITCIYNYKNQITEEPEMVLIVKIAEGYYEKITKVVKQFVNYDNFIGQIDIEKINEDFSSWLKDVVR